MPRSVSSSDGYEQNYNLATRFTGISIIGRVVSRRHGSQINKSPQINQSKCCYLRVVLGEPLIELS